MKRVLYAALTVLFLFVCLAGCSSNPKSVSDKIISHINQSITDETKTTKTILISVKNLIQIISIISFTNLKNPVNPMKKIIPLNVL